jgi:16S rRNA U1498 N3-methylase RsmE
MKAQIKGLSLDFNGRQILTLTLEKGEDFRQKFDDLNGKDLSVEVKEYRPKRSLNANNYAWQLITKLADALRIVQECKNVGIETMTPDEILKMESLLK